MGLSHSPSITADGLVLCLDAANPRSYPGSGSSWLDLSGNGNNGTFGSGTAAPTFSSGNGGSLVFDGSNDYVEVPSNLIFSNFITVDIWFRSIKSARHHLWNFGTGSNANALNCDVNDSGFTLWMYWNGSGGNALIFTSPSLTDGAIKNLVFVHNINTNSVYLNNSLLTGGFAIGTQTFSTVSGTIYVGSSSPGSAFTDGNIYNFKVYNRGLTPQEIQQNYNATKSRFGL